MISLGFGNKTLSLTKGFSMTIVRRSPFFRFDKIPGDVAYDVTFPKNEQTAAVLDNPELFEKRGTTLVFKDAWVAKGGYIEIEGTLFINDTSGDSYKGFITGVAGDLAQATREKKIRDFFKDEDQQLVLKNQYDPDEDPYCLGAVINRNFFKDKGIECRVIKKGKDNDYDTSRYSFDFFATSNFRVNNFENGQLVKDVDQLISVDDEKIYADKNPPHNHISVVSPFPFLSYMLRHCFSEHQLWLNKDNALESDPVLKNLCLYHNFDVTKWHFQTLADIVLGFDINTRKDSEYKKIARKTRNIEGFSIVDCLPHMSLAKALLGIQNLLNVIFLFDRNRKVDVVWRDDILRKAPAMELTNYAMGEFEKKGQIKQRLRFIMKHDSNDEAFSPFEDLSEVPKNKFLPDVETTLPWGTEIGMYCRVKANRTIWKFQHVEAETAKMDTYITDKDEGLGWKLVSVDFQPYLYGTGDEDLEITTEFSTLQKLISTPVCTQQGNSTAFPIEGESFSPRVLFYTYPGTVTPTTPELDLNWEGKSGLINRRYPLTAPLLSNHLKAERHFLLPDNIRRQLRFDEPYRTQEGAFLIDEIEYSLSAEDDDKTDVTLTVVKL